MLRTPGLSLRCVETIGGIWRICRVLLILVCAHAALLPLDGQQRLAIDVIDIEDGLQNRDIIYVTTDKRGFFWIVSSDIDMYDGQGVVHFNRFSEEHPLPVSSIKNACKLHDSLLVFAADNDLYALNMNTWEIQPQAYPEGLPKDSVGILSRIIDRQYFENLIFVTISEESLFVHLINRQTWSIELSHPIHRLDMESWRVWNYVNGPAGVFWHVDGSERHIVRASRDSVIHIPFNQYDLGARQYVTANHPDQGMLVIANDGRIYEVSAALKKVNFLFEVPFTWESNASLLVDKSGLIWILQPNGILRFDAQSQQYEVFNQKPFGRYTTRIRHCLEYPDGVHWLATEIGLLQVQKEPVPFVSHLKQPENTRNLQFREIMPGRDSTSLFARVNQGDRYIIEMQFDSAGVLDTTVWLYPVTAGGSFSRQGKFVYNLLGNTDFITRYHIEDFREERVLLPRRSMRDYYIQSLWNTDGTLCYRTNDNELTEFDPGSGRHRIIVQECSPNAMIGPHRAITRMGEDYLATGTMLNGLFVHHYSTGKLVGHWNTRSSEPLSSDFVNCLVVQGDSVIWVGTIGGGINRVNLITREIDVFTTNEGLPNNLIASLVLDNSDLLWIGTYGGLSMFDTKDEIFGNYNESDGLPDNEFNYLANHYSGDGKIFLGTFNGLLVFNPQDIAQRSPLPQPRITKIQKYNLRLDSLQVWETGLDDMDVFEVSPYDNFLQIDFALPDLRNPDGHLFSVKLDGLDRNWQDLGAANSVRYQKLPPGKYSLQIMGRDVNGNESTTPLQLDIRVRQIFYRSFWFMLLVLLLLSAAIYGLYRYRLMMLRKEQATRMRISSDLHDEIGSSLTRLSMQMQFIEQEADKPTGSKLTKLGELLGDVALKLRDLVWSVDSRSDQWGDMTGRMRDYAADTLHPRGINLTLDQNGIQEEDAITPEWKHHLYMIYKEAINNIAKHSNATTVTVHIDRQPLKGLQMTIQDNGKPTPEHRNVKGQGLTNLTMRVKRLRGQIDIGFNDQGFRVYIDIPQ